MVVGDDLGIETRPEKTHSCGEDGGPNWASCSCDELGKDALEVTTHDNIIGSGGAKVS